MLAPTAGAPLPQNDTVGEIAAFGARQTGQLDKANAEKAGARGIMTTCDRYQRKAIEEAKRRNRPWWKIF